jgi:hypothetical protein
MQSDEVVDRTVIEIDSTGTSEDAPDRVGPLLFPIIALAAFACLAGALVVLIVIVVLAFVLLRCAMGWN